MTVADVVSPFKMDGGEMGNTSMVITMAIGQLEEFCLSNKGQSNCLQ